MIPKIIHYVWIGEDNNVPVKVIECINSWKQKLSGYDIKLWNEKNFDISSCRYVEEAYRMKKYAFVSDYIRLWVLYNYGGIYLDTDVEVRKSFDDLLNEEGFLGFETEKDIGTCVIGCQRGNEIIGELLSDYKNRKFILWDGSNDLTPNVIFMTEKLKKYGLISNGRIQIVKGIMVYPRTYFSPRDYRGILNDDFSEETYAHHLFQGSWVQGENVEILRRKHEIEKKYCKVLGLIYYAIILLKKEGICQVLLQIRIMKIKKQNHR